MSDPILDYQRALIREFNPTGWRRVRNLVKYRLDPVSRWQNRGNGMVVVRVGDLFKEHRLLRASITCWLRGCNLDRTAAWCQFCQRCGRFIP